MPHVNCTHNTTTSCVRRPSSAALYATNPPQTLAESPVHTCTRRTLFSCFHIATWPLFLDFSRDQHIVDKLISRLKKISIMDEGKTTIIFNTTVLTYLHHFSRWTTWVEKQDVLFDSLGPNLYMLPFLEK